MEKYVSVLKETQLFAGVRADEVNTILGCFQAKSRIYKKEEYIFRQGEHLTHITVLVKGKLHIQRDDYWGNRSIVNVIHVGEMFGEAYVSPGSGPILNDIIAVDNSTVIFFDVRKMLNVCSSACRFHSKICRTMAAASSSTTSFLLS